MLFLNVVLNFGSIGVLKGKEKYADSINGTCIRNCDIASSGQKYDRKLQAAAQLQRERKSQSHTEDYSSYTYADLHCSLCACYY